MLNGSRRRLPHLCRSGSDLGVVFLNAAGEPIDAIDYVLNAGRIFGREIAQLLGCASKRSRYLGAGRDNILFAALVLRRHGPRGEGLKEPVERRRDRAAGRKLKDLFESRQRQSIGFGGGRFARLAPNGTLGILVTSALNLRFGDTSRQGRSGDRSRAPQN